MSIETTNKKIKIDNGTTFGRTYTDKAVDELLKNVGGGGKLEGFTIDVSDTYNPETKEFSGTLTDEQWSKIQNEQIYWIGVVYINNQETGEEASATLLYNGPFFGEGRAFSDGNGSVMFIYDKSVEGVIIKVALTIDTQNTPSSQLIPSITTSNEQQNLTIGNGLAIENGVLKTTGGGQVFFNLFMYYDEANNKITQEGWDKLSNGLINGAYCGILYDEIPLVLCGFNGSRTLYSFINTEEKDKASIKITVKSDLTLMIENIPVLNIPALPSDASSKTYTLQTVNGVLAWTDAIGDINTILDNINGEVI